MKKKSLIITLVVVLLIAAIAVAVIISFSASRADEISVDEAQGYIDDAFDGMVKNITRNSAKYIHDNATVTVNSLSYGINNEVLADCTITSLDTQGALGDHLDEIMEIDTNDENGRPIVSTKLKLLVDEAMLPYLEEAETVTEEYTIIICQVEDEYIVYTSDELVDIYTGGALTVMKDVTGKDTVTAQDGTVSDTQTNLRNAVKECLSLTFDHSKPATGNALSRWISDLYDRFTRNFITAERYQYLTRGMLNTLKITFFSVIIGIVLGFVIAIVRSSHDKLSTTPARFPLGRVILNFFNALAKVYLTVIRGTPVVVQLMIIYYIIFASSDVNKIVVAVLAFGLNSAAYVAEIVRGGIMSIDPGQMESGRSLGFNYVQTMIFVILPQTFKNVLPALANEFIVLLKETSVSGYIAIQDLTKGGDIIRSRTYDPFMPLIAVAVIYLVVVMILSWGVTKLERRLAKSDRH